jgi:hypothetical protein
VEAIKPNGSEIAEPLLIAKAVPTLTAKGIDAGQSLGICQTVRKGWCRRERTFSAVLNPATRRIDAVAAGFEV